jgi:hypothetical protein
MRSAILALLCLTTLIGCDKVYVIGTLRPILPVPEAVKMDLPVAGLKQKKLTPAEIEQLVDVLYRTNARAERMEATLKKYNTDSVKINQEIREGLGLTE